jgi:cytochrome c biogenesis protein CcmG, thiol:disulfide interchange protein DsbE
MQSSSDKSGRLRQVSFAVLSALVLLCACYTSSRPKNIGKPASDFTIQDSDRKLALSGFRGQVVVLNFWASWCPPCIAETPSLVAMQEKMKAKGITVVGVSIDEDVQAYHNFLKQYQVNFVTVRDPSQRVEHMYGTVQLPETYIIDRAGILRHKVVNSADWDSPEMLEYLRSL